MNDEFNKIADLLLLFPELGRKVENYDARFVIKGDYILFYKLKLINEELSIDILHIWDSRRNPDDVQI